MKLLKKIMTVAMATALITSTGIMCTMANMEYGYDTLTLDFEDGSGTDYSGTLKKDNASSGYVYSDPGNPYSFTAAMCGAISKEGSPITDIRKWYTSVQPGQGRYIYNYVYESGYEYAILEGVNDVDTWYQVFVGWQADTE